MTPEWPRAWGTPSGTAIIRSAPEDFIVCEQLGFELSGSGEHVFLQLQKRELNTLELQERIGALSGVPLRDIGLCGLKDRNAVTQQWFSVGMAGRAEPAWQQLEEAGDVTVIHIGRHQRKLRRGVHRANQFTLVLRDLDANTDALLASLTRVREQGVPNYFGEQRFGRGGSTLQQAQRWVESTRSASRKLTRSKRGFYFSALRAYLFNELLAQRVVAGDWNEVTAGDVAMLRGTRSFFACETPDAEMAQRCQSGDVHPGLPLYGNGESMAGPQRQEQQKACLAENQAILEFLERSDVNLAWRPARVIPDDFCWQFCDDGTLQLDFTLSAGSYATTLLSELVQYRQ